MSDMEHNKGRLIPQPIDTELFDEEAFETYEESGFVVIDREIYTVEWEVQRGELYGFADVIENEDGSISFNTWHYNGGAHWTEVVTNALEKQNE